MRTLFRVDGQQRSAQCVRLVAFVFLCTLFVPRLVAGQITFGLGTAPRQDTLYPTVEDCLGLVDRMEGLSREVDTTSGFMGGQVVSNKSRPLVRDAAQQCSRKFTVAQFLAPDTVSAAKMRGVFTLLYRAERISDAIALVDGWLAKVRDDTLRAELRYRIVNQTLQEEPTRFDVIRQLGAGFANTPFWAREYEAQGRLMRRTMELRDTVELNRIITWILETPTRLGDTAKVSQVSGLLVQAKEYKERETLLAKLKESTQSYNEFRNTLRKEFGMKETPDSSVLAPVTGDYWLPNKPATALPTRGKVALVIPVSNGEWNQKGMWGQFARKFPQIEITMITRTQGQGGRFVGTLTTAQEVARIDSLRKVREFPGTIVIRETKFSRVDEQYDRRVLEERDPNAKPDQYQSMRLIDKNGQFVDVGNLGLSSEETYELVLQALLSQTAATP